jgi:hypothetical protein
MMMITMAAAYGSFQEVARLSETSLRRLLDEGEPVERVWAAWTLGLRQEAAGLSAAAVAEPDCGVRRHFVVVLAGRGETAALVALAKEDPDGRVRATACQVIAHLAARDPTLWPVAERGLADDDAQVREAVLRHLGEDTPISVREIAIPLVADDSRDVRQAVIERLEAWLRSTTVLPECVERQALAEPDLVLRADLLGLWVKRAGPGPALQAAASAPVEAVSDLLDLLRAARAPVAWSEVAPVTGRSAMLDAKVFRLFETRLEEVPIAWVLAHLAGPGRRWALTWPIAMQLARRLERAAPVDLEPRDREALRAIASDAYEEVERSRDWADDDEPHTAALRHLVEEADRLAPMVH